MESKIDELEYLMNPILYTKWTATKEFGNNKDFDSDLKFYKKRIVQLTKNMSKGEKITGQLDASFMDYARSCITYFKYLDRKDILQEEYTGLKMEEYTTSDILDVNADDNLINPTYKHQKCTINDFIDIKIISTKKKENEKLPIQKTLQLNKDEFKTKGVKKKNKTKPKGIKKDKKCTNFENKK